MKKTVSILLAIIIVLSMNINVFAAMCGACHGSGYTTCIRCKGLGTIDEYDYSLGYYKKVACPVYNCLGGDISCVVCGGSGQIPDGNNNNNNQGNINNPVSSSATYPETLIRTFKDVAGGLENTNHMLGANAYQYIIVFISGLDDYILYLKTIGLTEYKIANSNVRIFSNGSREDAESDYHQSANDIMRINYGFDSYQQRYIVTVNVYSTAAKLFPATSAAETPPATTTPTTPSTPAGTKPVIPAVSASNTSTAAEFEITSSGILNKYTGNKAHIAIPDGVTLVGTDSITGNSNVYTVRIPLSTTKISYTFDKCPNLSAVLVPTSVKEIYENAFKDSPNVTLYVAGGSFAETWAKEKGIPSVRVSEKDFPGASVQASQTTPSQPNTPAASSGFSTADALAILRDVVGSQSLTAAQREKYGFEAGYKPTTTDALAILRAVVGITQG